MSTSIKELATQIILDNKKECETINERNENLAKYFRNRIRWFARKKQKEMVKNILGKDIDFNSYSVTIVDNDNYDNYKYRHKLIAQNILRAKEEAILLLSVDTEQMAIIYNDFGLIEEIYKDKKWQEIYDDINKAGDALILSENIKHEDPFEAFFYSCIGKMTLSKILGEDFKEEKNFF